MAERADWQFEPGNTASVTHGAHSKRKVIEAAERLRPELAGALHAAPWIADIDQAEVDSWLEAEAIKNMLVGELATRFAANANRIADKDRWLFERIGAAQNRAQQARDRLLLNPQSRRKAGRDDAGIEDVLAAQREVGARLRSGHVEVLDVPSGDSDAESGAADGLPSAQEALP